MKKFIILTFALILTINMAKSETAPVPKCSCNDISSQIDLEKKAELKLQDEMKKTDKKIENSEKNIEEKTEQIINKTKKKKPWWRLGK
ncbi:hypothetical protein J6Q66_08345 [bacterium]|nr:hypothetical protein [bacterium]